MIIGLGCACQEQSGTGIRGLGDCGDQPPASSVTYADWYNCWNAEQAHPTPPITNWIAFDGGGNPVSVTPATVSKPTVVVPYTAPLPTNIPVASGSSTLPTDTYTSSTTDFKNIIAPSVATVPVVSTPANPVIGINSTVPPVIAEPSAIDLFFQSWASGSPGIVNIGITAAALGLGYVFLRKG